MKQNTRSATLKKYWQTVPEEDRKSRASNAAKKRWANISTEKRREIALKMVEARKK